MALHHEFQGSDEGLALWDDWSTRGAKYKEGEPERLWASFGGYSGQPLTAAYLLKLTKKPAPVDPNFFKALPWSTSRFVADPPAIPMIIEGFLPQGVISLFYSAGGAGKSTIVLYMAVKIALAESFNTDFLGHYVQGGKVVIVTAEDPDLILNRRFVGCLESIAEELDVTPEALRPTVDANLSIVSTFGHSVQLFSLRADGILVTSEYYDSLSTALCEVQGLQLVIIDTKTRFSPGEGLGNVTATQEITHYEALAKTTGASVMLLHHSNKSSRDGSGTGAQAYRDATALFDSVRAAWYLRGLTEAELSAQEVTLEDKRAYLLLENSKNNYIPQDVDKVLKRVGYRYEVSKLKPRMTNVDKKELKRQQAYDRVIDLLQSHIGEPYHQSAIISICANRNMSRQRVIDALKDCEEDGMVLKIEKGICKKYSLTEEGKMYKLTVDEVA
jgi:RecA-family ATPase